MRFESSQEYFEPSAKPAEQKTKPEIGKRYVLRNSWITGPLTEDDGKRPYMWVDVQAGMAWTGEGKWWIDERESPFDIVAEYVETPAKPPEPEYQWVWGNVDRPGIWAFGGSAKEDPRAVPEVRHIWSVHKWDAQWVCFICEFPQIAPPKRKVKKVLWLRGPANAINPDGTVLLEKQRIAEGAMPTNVASGWLIKTDVVKEFDA